MIQSASIYVLGVLTGFAIPHVWNYVTWKLEQRERGTSWSK